MLLFSFMNKKELVVLTAKCCDLSYKKAAQVVDTVLDLITSSIEGGEKVSLHDFGSFESYVTKEKRAVHPATKETITILAGRRVRFKAFQKLRNKLKKEE